jgi:hypothetical protein
MSAPAGSGRAAEGSVVARRGDLVVVHLRRREHQDGEPAERDEFQAGQATSVTRDGRPRLWRPAGRFAGEPDYLGRPDRGQPLPTVWFQRTLIMSAGRVDVQGALATAACHVWPGHEDHDRAYDSLDEVRAAIRPHLLARPGWERLRQAAADWETARKAARPLLSAAVHARGEEFRRLSRTYDSAVTAANTAYRQQYEQTAAQGDAR